MKPGLSFDELYRTLSANKPSVTARQRKLLESRYDLTPRLDPNAKMSRGKPLAGGPTARLPQGVNWESLAAMSPDEIRRRDIFPYIALPLPAQTGALSRPLFPQLQILMVARVERDDVAFDL